MSSLAAVHPQVVHFVIALLIVGVLFRLVSLTGKLTWTNQAAASLIVLGTVASAVAVKSGMDAHGPVERVPGSRPVVQEHEEAGETTRNIFLGVTLLELGALALSGGTQRALRFGSAAVGLVGLFFLYETGEEGGELVYSYAGGIGLRTGEPEDVGRLLLAGQYHQAMLDRKNGVVIDEDGVRAKWGVGPESIADWLALVGDSADGYPGLPGWGEKSASTLLATYRHLEAIPDEESAWTVKVRGAARLARTLAERRGEALLFKRLATLRLDAPVRESLADLEWKGARPSLRALCERLGFPDVAGRVPRWRDG